MPKVDSVKVEIGLPAIGKIEGTWVPDESEQSAAWELYIELITRISITSPEAQGFLLRESLSSLHSLFATTRAILRRYGPSVARPKGKNVLSLGYLAVTILNSVLRPFLSKWPPLLLDYETTKPDNVSTLTHEQRWEYYSEFHQSLRTVQKALIEYADVLAEVAKVPLLVQRDNYL
jgi:hypothetical protein